MGDSVNHPSYNIQCSLNQKYIEMFSRSMHLFIEILQQLYMLSLQNSTPDADNLGWYFHKLFVLTLCMNQKLKAL